MISLRGPYSKNQQRALAINAALSRALSLHGREFLAIRIEHGQLCLWAAESGAFLHQDGGTSAGKVIFVSRDAVPPELLPSGRYRARLQGDGAVVDIPRDHIDAVVLDEALAPESEWEDGVTERLKRAQTED